MNLLFTFIVTGIMVVLGLLSLGDDFPYTPLYILLSMLGLGVSYWQQTKRDIPYIRIIANLILIALTVKALLPFFAGKPRYDMFTALITTWIYFLILSTYIIHTKRDYYIIQGFSLGLIVYACFYATHNPLHLLGYTAAFLVMWIMALRNSNLFPEKKEKTIFYTTRDIWREIKLGAVLFFTVVIVSLPFYFLLPRFNIPLLPMDQLLRQRYSAIYSDFPKRGLVAYLSRNPRDIMTEKREKEGETPSPAVRGGTQPQLDLRQNVKKPIFWHGKEAMDDLLQEIKNTDQQLKTVAKQKETQNLNKQEEKVKEEKKKLEKELEKAKEEQAELNKARENMSPEEAANPAAVEQLEEKIKNVGAQIEAIMAALKDLEAKIDKIEELKRQLVELNKPTEIEKAMQEYQKLTEQQEKIIQQKKELERALQQARQNLEAARQEYAKLAENTANLTAKQLAQLEELKQKIQTIENKIEVILTSLEKLDAQLQKIEEAKVQIRAYIYKEPPEIRQLWNKKEEQQKQLAAMQEQMAAFLAQQETATAQQQQQEAAAAAQQAAAALVQQQIAAALAQQQAAAAAAQQQQQEATQQQQEAAAAAQQQANQEKIEQLEQKIRVTTQEIQDLAQQRNLPQVQKDIQEHQKLIEQEEAINQQKKELEQALQQARQEYVEMAALQANPPQVLAGNAAALKELENRMKDSVQKIENMASERKSMDKQIDKIRQAINNIRDSIYKQSARSTQKIRILFDQKEEQLDQLKKAKEEEAKGKGKGKALTKGKASGQYMESEEEGKGGKEKGGKKKTEIQKSTRQITILDIILYILIIITAIYIFRSILTFIFPYLKHKRRISQASRKEQYNLSVSLIYNFLGRVLYIFGYKYPVVMLPEEYLRAVNKRFAAISHYTQDLTSLFIEARYSNHRLNPDQERQAFENYRNILQELKNSGAAWQRQILKIRFLFEL
jgi:hypothetical protein